ncbi:MAG: hypothetical protein J0H62_10625 [Rhizobiales bacterium]|nr:hypothetical protein [Hyphomicrobiales bacterium]
MVKNMFPGRRICVATLLLLSAAGSFAAEAPPPQAVSAPPEQAVPVAVNWRTGLAIHGVDPVAYFVDGRVVEGQGAFEHVHAGAVWRFVNEGNRAAFKADPDVYMPLFGGNDPVALARGVAVSGNPYVWTIQAGRLVLFHTQEAREIFLRDPAAAIEAATPDVREPAVPAPGEGEAARAAR